MPASQKTNFPAKPKSGGKHRRLHGQPKSSRPYRSPLPSLKETISQSGKRFDTTEQTTFRQETGSTLFEELCRPENLKRAWKELRSNRPAATRRFSGAIDRVSLDKFERSLESNIYRLRDDLRRKRYRPDPVIHFSLPKAGGGSRTLAVLTVKDRLVQRAVLNLIEPLFEPNFLACSYAFRPDRSREDALRQVELYYAEGWRWVVDADIEAFFDNIDRERLFNLLAERVKDRQMLALLQLWLTAHASSAPVHASPAIQPFSTSTEAAKAEIRRPKRLGRTSISEQESNGKLAHLAQNWLEGGLDWGIARLGRDSSVRPRYPRRPSYYSMTNWDDDDEENGYFPEQRPGEGKEIGQYEDYLKNEALRRLGADGAMLGLAMLKEAVRRGWVPGTAGLVLKTGTTLGTAGAVGLLAWQKWRRKPPKAGLNTEAEFLEFYQVPPEKRGIAQGSVLSPLFSNIFLHEFDREITGRGWRLVRFADDLLILGKSEREAGQGLDEAEQVLARIGLNFKPEKTRVAKLEKGFRFLGAELDEKGHWLDLAPKVNPLSGGLPSKETEQTWLTKAGKGWLGRSVRERPGVVQRGRRNLFANLSTGQASEVAEEE